MHVFCYVKRAHCCGAGSSHNVCNVKRWIHYFKAEMWFLFRPWATEQLSLIFQSISSFRHCGCDHKEVCPLQGITRPDCIRQAHSLGIPGASLPDLTVLSLVSSTTTHFPPPPPPLPPREPRRLGHGRSELLESYRKSALRKPQKTCGVKRYIHFVHLIFTHVTSKFDESFGEKRNSRQLPTQANRRALKTAENGCFLSRKS